MVDYFKNTGVINLPTKEYDEKCKAFLKVNKQISYPAVITENDYPTPKLVLFKNIFNSKLYKCEFSQITGDYGNFLEEDFQIINLIYSKKSPENRMEKEDVLRLVSGTNKKYLLKCFSQSSGQPVYIFKTTNSIISEFSLDNKSSNIISMIAVEDLIKKLYGKK